MTAISSSSKRWSSAAFGLQNSGKTTLVNVVPAASEDMIPTVGFNMRKVTRKVTIKLWDLGGSQLLDVGAVLPWHVRDRVHGRLGRRGEHRRVEDRAARPLSSALEKIPLLVLGNKNDLPESLGVDELIEKLNLKALVDANARCSISAKNSVNIDITIDYLHQALAIRAVVAGLRRQIIVQI